MFASRCGGKERLAMDDMDMGNEAILLRVATLRVTLGLALQKLLLAGLHFQSSKIDQLLHKLNNMLGNAGDNVKARLEKCIEHCNRMWMEEMAEQVTSLVDLLCGIEEDDDRVQEKRFPQVVALDDILTAPLEVLLRDEDDDSLSPANELHCFCQKIFKQALKTSPRAAVTAGKVLEYAYLWVLACRSHKFSRLDFVELFVQFQCKNVRPGYIFQKNSKSLDSAKVAEMQNATLYYAKVNHPCADIFFKDDSGALYLVDVGGTSNMSKALNKVQKMNDVLVKEGLREDLQVSELKGVVLLPNIESISPEDLGSISEAITVRGARARRLLGGLAQLLAWLPAVWSPKLANPIRAKERRSAWEKEQCNPLQPNICEKHDTTFVVDCCVIADFGSDSEDDDWERKKSPFIMERNSTAIENSTQWLLT